MTPQTPQGAALSDADIGNVILRHAARIDPYLIRMCRDAIAADRRLTAEGGADAWAYRRNGATYLSLLDPRPFANEDVAPVEWCRPLVFGVSPLTATPATEKPNRAFALTLLSAAAKSGDPGAIELAAQLAGCPPCEVCGYVIQHCRCAALPQPQAEGKQ